MPRTAMTAALLVAALFGFSCKLRTEEKPPETGVAEAEPRRTAPRELGSPPTEARIRLYLAQGGEVRITLNRMYCADLNELAATLAALVEGDPGLVAVIDARAKVPFRWVFGALDACKRAKVEDVRFQAPPIERAGGDKWWLE